MSMQPTSNRKKIIWAVIAVVVVFVAWIVYAIIQNLDFKLTGTSPKTNNVSTITPYIKIDFNRQLTKNGLSVSMAPAKIKSYAVTGESLYVSFNYPLEIDKEYVITINSISSVKGETIINKQIKFKTKNIPSSELPKEQQETLLDDQDQYPAATSDPILRFIPDSTENTKIDPVIKTDANQKTTLTVHVQILLSVSDSTSSDKQAIIDSYKQEVYDYFAQYGLDPAKYTIDYEIVESSRY